MNVKYNFLKKSLLIGVVLICGGGILEAWAQKPVTTQNRQINLKYNKTPTATAYQNAKVISVANPHPVVSGSGKSLIGSRTETFTPETTRNGDVREIILLSTPAGTPFSPNINSQNTDILRDMPFSNYQVEVWFKTLLDDTRHITRYPLPLICNA